MVVAMLLALLGGCSKATEEKPTAGGETKVAATPASTAQPAVVPQNVENTQAYAYLHQSFQEATLDETPQNLNKPPDVTVAGKKTAEILRQVRGENGTGGLWEQIRFMTPQGKRISYEAVVKTAAGEFHIELLPDAAPNHVRNFIALARAGYYDGLFFDYIIPQKFKDDCTLVLAGCPLGTNEFGHGHIGYWLKPEANSKYAHDEGTVGAWPLENAACKFYISMTRAPGMDTGGYTVFGRISKGLEVARKLAQSPLQTNDGQETGFPVEPIVMQSVTILQKTEE